MPQGQSLKTALYQIITDHTARSYDQLWTDMQKTDVREDGKVWDMYSSTTDFTFSSDQCGNYSGEGSCYNREHSFPKSWFNKASPMYTDLFHLQGGVERLVNNNEDAQVDPWEVTNGAKGYNSVSRHIVYAGGVAKDGKTPKDTRTGCQKKALEKYVKDFHRRFPDVRIVGHNELAAKACPSFDVQKWLKEIGINQ